MTPARIHPLFSILPSLSSFLYLLFSLLPLCSSAQQHLFTNYSIDQGLSQSVVNALFQDSKGFIWIGTQNGLNKFDGYSFESFTTNPNDTTTISNNWIYSITEDRDGNLWIATKGGLNKFNPTYKRFQRINYKTAYIHPVAEYLYDVKNSFNGTILLNTPPVLTIYNPKSNEFRHFYNQLEYDGAVKDNTIPLIEDFEGLIWIGSTRGLSCFDRNTQTFKYFLKDEAAPNSISDNYITALYEDKKGNIWIGTANGLNRYSKVTRTFTSFYNNPNDPSSLSNNFIRAIVQDYAGNLWIGTEGGGLSKMTLNGDVARFENLTSDNNGLSHNIVLALKIDRSNNLWVGALQGISKTDLKKQKFQLYRKEKSPYSVDLLGNVVASIYKAPNGLLWIGNWGQGLNIYNRATGEVIHYSSRLSGKYYLPNDFIHVIFPDKQGVIWLGTRDGILIYDKAKQQFQRFEQVYKNPRLPNLKGVRIYSILLDRAGNYWIGTQNGLFKINLEKMTSEVFTNESEESHTISSNLIYGILEDQDGLLWIATLGGLDQYNPSLNKMRHFYKSNSPGGLSDNFIISLCEDQKGDIWVGTSSFVNRYNKKKDRFESYTQEHGLPSNRIFEIVEDQQSQLWFATGNGLCRFDSVHKTFRTYTVEEGLQGREFNLRASYRSEDGELFFGGMNGFNSFYPATLTDNPFIPPIVITSLSKLRGGIKEYIDLENTEEISLHYNDYNITLSFAALEFTNPANNRFAYKMDGVTDDWIDIGNTHQVTFSKLSAGEYLFRVKGSNNDGKWNETGKTLKIIVHPPWWKSKLAWIVYLITGGMIVILIIRQRELNLVKARDHLEAKVQERTTQIEQQKKEILLKKEELEALNNELTRLNATKDKFFSIIAHDLRNPFNTILGLSDILLSDFKNFDPDKIAYYLANIKESSNQAFELLQNLLIWARSQTGGIEFTPTRFDLLVHVADTIELVAAQATKKNILIESKIALTAPISGDKNMIDTILRNLLTNAIKFTAQGGKVTVEAHKNDHQVSISVIDTGVGIAKDMLVNIFKIETKHTTKGTDKEKGTGLGLILCKEFAERHGGKILVQSEPGKGSTFTLLLPQPE